MGRDPGRVDALAAELGPAAAGFVADVTVSADVDAAVAASWNASGPRTRSSMRWGPRSSSPSTPSRIAELDDVLAVNLLSAVYALRAFVRAVPRGRPASVVLFSSAATRIGLLNHEAIAVAKGGIDGLVTSAAATYAGRGIRVNALAPGLVRSNLTRRLVEHEGSLRASVAMHPLGRIGEAEDVAGLAAFLVSPDAAWITGQVIAVDGGLSGVKLPPSI